MNAQIIQFRAARTAASRHAALSVTRSETGGIFIPGNLNVRELVLDAECWADDRDLRELDRLPIV